MPETRFQDEPYSGEVLFNSVYAAMSSTSMTEAEEAYLKKLIANEPQWRNRISEITDLWNRDKRVAKKQADELMKDLRAIME